MKISVDLDGTLYAHAAFFRAMFLAYQPAGHQVGVLTGHSAESEEHDRLKLSEMGFMPSFYLGRTPAYIPRNGMYFKLDMIAEHGIDLHFDDLDYNHHDTTRILSEAPDELRQRIVIVPHKGHGVRSE